MNNKNLNKLLIYIRKTHSKLTRYCLLIIAVMQILFTLPVLAKDNLSYFELKGLVEAAHSIRNDFLDHSTGKARAVFNAEMKGGKKAENKLIKRFVEQFGTIHNVESLTGQKEWDVEWYKKDSKNRYDIKYSVILETKDETKIPINKRIVVTPEKGIYYNPLTKRAYVNTPPIKRPNPAYMQKHFDIDFCYHIFGGKDLQAMLNYYENLGIKPDIEKSFINERKCIKLEYYKEFKVKSGKTKKAKSCIWISPEMSYSVIKAELYSNRATDYNDLKLLESYEATYEEAKNYKGQWVLKNVRRFDNQGFRAESIAIEFEDFDIGVKVSDEMFTFEGLDVPPGTKVFDKTVKGQQPIQYYYISYPIGKVDELISEINSKDPDNMPATQVKIFLPRMKQSLKDKKPYILDLEKKEFVKKTELLEKANDLLNNNKTDFIVWDNAFLVSKDIVLSQIVDKGQSRLRLNKGKIINAYFLPDEFELPLKIKWQRQKENVYEYEFTVEKIDMNGILICNVARARAKL